MSPESLWHTDEMIPTLNIVHRSGMYSGAAVSHNRDRRFDVH